MKVFLSIVLYAFFEKIYVEMRLTVYANEYKPFFILCHNDTSQLLKNQKGAYIWNLQHLLTKIIKKMNLLQK